MAKLSSKKDGPSIKHDISIPVSKLLFIKEAEASIKKFYLTLKY